MKKFLLLLVQQLLYELLLNTFRENVYIYAQILLIILVLVMILWDGLCTTMSIIFQPAVRAE